MSPDQADHLPAPTPTQRLTGDITSFGLRPILQEILASNQLSGVLFIHSLDYQTGTILLVDGIIRAAVIPAANVRRIPALRQMLSAISGTYEYVPDNTTIELKKPTNVDLAELLAWRSTETQETTLGDSLEALNTIPLSTGEKWENYIDRTTDEPGSANPPPGSAEAPTVKSYLPLAPDGDLFGLQEALRQHEAKLAAQVSDEALSAGLEPEYNEDPDVPTLINLSAIKAIPTPSVTAPDRITASYEMPDGTVVGGSPTGSTAKPKHTYPKSNAIRYGALSIGIGFLLLAAVVISTAKVLEESDRQKTYARGVQLLKERYYGLAKQRFDSLLEHDARLVPALLQRAQANLLLNDPQAAIRDYDAVIQADAGNTEATDGRAACYLKLRDYPKAVALADEALKVKPNDYAALLIKATAYRDLGENARAISVAGEIIAKKPAAQLAEAYAVRGDALYRSGKYSEARDDFNAALETDPKANDIYAKRAMALLQLKLYKESLADSTDAIFADNTNSDLYMLRGQAYERLGELEKAVEDYEQAVSFEPTFETYAARARVEMALKQYNRAVADLTEVVKDTAAPPSYKDLLAEAKEKVKSMPINAVDIASLTEKDRPAVVLKYDQMVRQGFALTRQGRGMDAAQLLSVAVQAQPNDVQARRYLAQAFAVAGLGDRSIEQFKIVERTNTLTDEDRFYYARALHNLKQDAQVISVTTDLLGRDPHHGEARCLLIESLLRSNDRARALEECRLGASYARTPQDIATFQRLYQVSQTYHR
ncbi:MAG: tetratricopeptide repeat protein [Candidatus Obscuribacterales bacterium]